MYFDVVCVIVAIEHVHTSCWCTRTHRVDVHVRIVQVRTDQGTGWMCICQDTVLVYIGQEIVLV